MVLPNVYNVGYSAGQAVRAVLDHHADLPSLPEAWELILSFPVIYKNWWWNLVTNDPFHVLVETTLIAFCIYMIIISRSKDYRSERKERLSKKEEEELLREWREEERDGLAPETLPAQNFMIVHAMNGRTMKIQKKSSPKDDTMDVLNFATNDFLGMSGNEQVKEASRLALNKYGCGSCGPRGFYGTIDVHLDLEQAIADFIGTEGAIMYSDGASTVSSTVAAFAKRGDLLVVDDGIYEPLVTGVTLSRANLFWFRHNDMADLRRVLEKVQQTDKALGRKSRDQRRFIVVEGLYKNTGTICPLDELVALKHEFKYRLILDESFSFGTLGETGKGVMELFGKRHMYDAEIVTISLENSLGSIGGVTVGNEEVVDHQRLSGAGYCFSASSPPFTASAAIQSLQNLEKNPELVKILRDNVRLFHEKLKTVGDDLIPGTLVVTSDERSPIVYMELATEHDDGALLDAIADECLAKGKVALVSTKRYHAKQIPIPAIRLAISAAHTREDIDEVVQVLQQAVRANAKRAS